ncbi:Mur ligase [Synergistales bacterium]|nr:Mur ligase [Synergistales bacterium]
MTLFSLYVLLAALLILCHLSISLRGYHIFQLNSYKTGVQIAWFSRNLANAWSPMRAAAKKPLVYTPRMLRMFATHLVVLLAGMAVSFHSGAFCALAFAAVAALSAPIFPLLSNLLNAPFERAINRWYIEDAKKILKSMPNLRVIGVTGSYGKTSVKNFLRKVLASEFNVLMTPESYNTTLGVVKTIRSYLSPAHDIFICEMGARKRGDIKEICDIVNPGFGVITSIGEQHLESFGAVSNIVKAKFELADALPRDGLLFLNIDNEFIQERVSDGSCPLPQTIVRWSVSDARGEARENIYRAFNLSVSLKGSVFTVAFPDGEERTFETQLIGVPNVTNILASVAVADNLGVERTDIVISVARLEPVPHRLQLLRNARLAIIDDAYNSNPNGAQAALSALSLFDGYFKILVTPGMVELGEKEDELNRRFGAQAAEVCDFVILVGEGRANRIKSIFAGLRDAGYEAEKIFVSESLSLAFEKINLIDAGRYAKIVLLENDLPDNY